MKEQVICWMVGQQLFILMGETFYLDRRILSKDKLGLYTAYPREVDAVRVDEMKPVVKAALQEYLRNNQTDMYVEAIKRTIEDLT